ncbi:MULTISPECIES: XisI protein [Aphanizomenon]|uniref:XisI protein n=1 Tax=Aphanizomenon TaxID=1175 RepID=UPI0005439B88|nr:MULTISPECIES: XisI protein [Aphanizomenon]KHG40178.1 DNA element excision controlling factor XisI [Aphanizomenon flos-aquae 2012/KM1/D3]KHG43167.1 DNA element excision controlling factor XisI [Aphanizomenon flos-aquae 2012/KM1/D3]MTJ29521.1 XisI protein [Aphanizomenon sp. UHCC 0183]QSV73390.1 MAG: XisI protein [Aphanizomenon flos-aquae KM1D3_PB]
MDKLEQYQIAIKQVLTEYHNWVSGAANLTDESCLIFDDDHHHYIWCFLGWDGKKRTNNIQVNIRIKNDKIWIEEDWTEEGIANELMRLGISNLDIVLAFHPPEERKYTAFATA